MKNLFKARSGVDTSEVTDPLKTHGIDRRTLYICALGIGCVVVAAIIFTNAQTPSISGSSVAPPSVDTDPTYAGVLQVQSASVLPDDPEHGTPAAWQSPMAPAPTQAVTPEKEREDVFHDARKGGGGLFFSQSPTNTNSSTGDTPPAAIVPTNDRTILEGTTIPAVLETHVDSDRPGPVRARVLDDVRDTKTKSNVLIPAGTLVLGAMQVQGLSVAVTWHRLVFPDGNTMNVDQLPSIDQGGGGLAGDVDRHRLARVGGATLSALLGVTSTVAGAQLSENGGIYGGALALQLGQTGTQTLKRVVRPPTITVPLGHTFDIWVTADLTIPS